MSAGFIPALDMLGREIKAGDTIAYALTVGRSANLAIYTVDEVVNTPAHGFHGGKYGDYTAVKLKVTKRTQSYGGQQTKQSTLAMADERALVITGHGK